MEYIQHIDFSSRFSGWRMAQFLKRGSKGTDRHYRKLDSCYISRSELDPLLLDEISTPDQNPNDLYEWF